MTAWTKRSAAVSGFTLIELSVVLVIIGLAIGSILVGRDLIDSSVMRSQFKQLDEFRVAESTFRLKYDYIPGDVPPALTDQFALPHLASGWNSLQNVNGSGYLNGFYSVGLQRNLWGVPFIESLYYFPHLSTFTCDRDGNGKHILSGSGLLRSDSMEARLMFGLGCDPPSPHPLGGVFPRSKLNPNFGILPVTANRFSLSTWYILNAQSWDGLLSSYTGTPSMSPRQAYEFDRKVDDGIPSQGDVRAYKTVSTEGGVDEEIDNDDVAGQCVTNVQGSSYNTTNSSVVCRIIVKK